MEEHRQGANGTNDLFLHAERSADATVSGGILCISAVIEEQLLSGDRVEELAETLEHLVLATRDAMTSRSAFLAAMRRHDALMMTEPSHTLPQGSRQKGDP